MKHIKTLAMAAILGCAATGAFAEGGIGGGDGVGDGTAGSNAGTTGWMAETLHGSTITANRVMPADGSNSIQGGTLYAGTRTNSANNTAMLGAGPAPASATLPTAGSTTMLPGAVLAQSGTSETVSGDTRTVVTRYWSNVPAGVERDADFQRWLRLR